MTVAEGGRIVDVDREGRLELEPILDESFEGWYLRHSKRTLRDIETVRAFMVDGRPVGLTMLKPLGDGVGYIYYVAVARAFRSMGLGGALLDDALAHFSNQGSKEVYASVENETAHRLFIMKGFGKTSFGEVAKNYGVVRAVALYRTMLVVPGEALLKRDLIQVPDGA